MFLFLFLILVLVNGQPVENRTEIEGFTYHYPAPIQTNPFRAMEEMMRNVEERFRSLFGSEEFADNIFSQPCQQKADEVELNIRCNVTGYDSDQLKVNVQGKQLTIAGKKEEANSTVSFSQVLVLSDYDLQQMKSTVDADGMLTVIVPKL
ncbi:Heat shock protein Hsp20 domain containing protein [Aphelenchoides besseyi]|nr:Heat shock protein Hsp20 domain containing protein [Aphelenchoides besseyi]KAI6231388.1 Heat shock protein Hsp20 domain containing protein [Aphelenchoides besseyi]